MKKIPILIWKFPLLLLLAVLQAVLKILDRLSGFCIGLLTLVLAGFWIHHYILGNRENVILLSISLAVCVGIPVVLQVASASIRHLTDVIL